MGEAMCQTASVAGTPPVSTSAPDTLLSAPPTPVPNDRARGPLRSASCAVCQQRKIRCDRTKPCANCVKAGVECYIPARQPRRRKVRPKGDDLVERLRRYEGLMLENGIEFDSIDNYGHRLGKNGVGKVDALEGSPRSREVSHDTTQHADAEDATDSDRSREGFYLHKQFKALEQILHDDSDNEESGSFIHRAFDKKFNNKDNILYVGGGPLQCLMDAHPSTVHIFQLWQIYVDNVNPLLKVTHIPTVQGQILNAVADLSKAPQNIECLLFAIYTIAISSLEEAQVRERFGDSKRSLQRMYAVAAQQAFVNAGFMRVNDLVTLQAFFIYLYAIQRFTDPRQTFLLSGMAVRIAQGMGLHRDPGNRQISSFEVQQRRRLWWAIADFDRRIGDVTDSTVTALCTGSDCKIPLNLNDSDLHMDAKEVPAPHTGPTEMVFVLSRAEASMAMASSNHTTSTQTQHGASHSEESRYPTIYLVADPSATYTVDSFCDYIETKYLAQCDPKIPLHFFTLTVTRQVLCWTRFAAYISRLYQSSGASDQTAEHDKLFLLAVQMVEYDNVIRTSPMLQRFKWFAMQYLPAIIYIFLVQDLRRREQSPLVERAWEAFSANQRFRSLLEVLYNSKMTSFDGRPATRDGDQEHMRRGEDLHYVEMASLQQANGNGPANGTGSRTNGLGVGHLPGNTNDHVDWQQSDSPLGSFTPFMASGSLFSPNLGVPKSMPPPW